MAEIDVLNYESRLSALEEGSIVQATKEDLAKLKADLIKWLVGTKIVFAALLIYLLQ